MVDDDPTHRARPTRGTSALRAARRSLERRSTRLRCSPSRWRSTARRRVRCSRRPSRGSEPCRSARSPSRHPGPRPGRRRCGTPRGGLRPRLRPRATRGARPTPARKPRRPSQCPPWPHAATTIANAPNALSRSLFVAAPLSPPRPAGARMMRAFSAPFHLWFPGRSESGHRSGDTLLKSGKRSNRETSFRTSSRREPPTVRSRTQGGSSPTRECTAGRRRCPRS